MCVLPFSPLIKIDKNLRDVAVLEEVFEKTASKKIYRKTVRNFRRKYKKTEHNVCPLFLTPIIENRLHGNTRKDS